MPSISLFMPREDEERPWPELVGSQDLIYVLGNDHQISMARMPAATETGASSVIIRIDLPGGKVVLAETTMKLFQMAAAAFRGAMERDGEVME